MQEYKIKLALSIVSIILFIDLYSWHGVKAMLKNKSALFIKRFKIVWWTIPVLLLLLFAATQLYIPLQTNTVLRVYLSAAIFIIYLSKVILLLFVVIDDIRRFVVWIKKKLTYVPQSPSDETS